ncbi:MAG: hypothetical protein ACR2KV_13610 [Solirubrobacteraceae bacterium]
MSDEFSRMRVGKASPEAVAALDSLYGVYRGFTPARGSQAEFYRGALAHLDAVASARRERLAISAEGLPGVLTLMLLAGVFLVLIIEYRPGLGSRSQIVFMGTLALLVSSTYALTVVLDYPFSGDSSVSSGALESGNLAALMPSPLRVAQAGDRPLWGRSRKAPQI